MVPTVPSEEMREASYTNPNSFLDDDAVARKILSEIVETRLESTPSGNLCLGPDATERSYGSPIKSLSPSTTSTSRMASPDILSISLGMEGSKSPKAEPQSKKSLPVAKNGSSPPPTMQDLEYCEDLAVAVAVYDDSNENSDDGYLPTGVEYDPDSKAKSFGKDFYRRFRWFLLALAVLITGAVAFSVVSVQNGEEEQPTEWMRVKVESLLGGDMKAQEDAYRKALEWMMYHDPTREELTESDSNFTQRFVMTYFYFATSVDQEWAYCAPPQEFDKPTCKFSYSTKFLTEEEQEAITIEGYRWLSELHVCEWVGVTCNDYNEIEAIELDGLEQTGTFPQGIFHLSSLQTFRVTDSALRGSLPSDLMSRMPQLQKLLLRMNEFTGTIPIEWFSSATPLTRLDISSNHLTGSIPSEVGLLENLNFFVLYNNGLNGTIPEEVLGGIPSLTDIELNSNMFTGTVPTSVGSLSNLILLNLNLNNLHGSLPSEIGLLNETLVSLNLGLNDFSGELPSSLYDLKNLVSLDVSGCRFNGTIKQTIARSFPLMRDLYINNNQFSGTLPEQVSAMKNLKKLRFEDNAFTGVLPEGLCHFVSEACCEACCQIDGSPCNATQHSTD